VRIDLGKREQLIDLGAYLVGLVFGLGILVASGYADWPGDALGRSDFAKFWAGPRALLLGRDPYDAGTWIDPTLQLGATLINWPDHGSTPRYFGWAVLLMFPFALLPLATAFALWTVGGIAAAAAAIYALLRRTLHGYPIAYTLIAMTLLASQPARLTVLLGQWGFMLTAALVATVIWTREGRSTRAGLSSIAFLAKPQLFVLTAPALAIWAWRRGQLRAIAVATVAGAAIVGLSLVLLPGWPAAWIRDIASPGVTTDPQTTTLASVADDDVTEGNGPSGAAGPIRRAARCPAVPGSPALRPALGHHRPGSSRVIATRSPKPSGVSFFERPRERRVGRGLDQVADSATTPILSKELPIQ